MCVSRVIPVVLTIRGKLMSSGVPEAVPASGMEGFYVQFVDGVYGMWDSVQEHVIPVVSSVVSKVQNVWEQVLPHVAIWSQLAMSKIGVGLGFMAFSIVPLWMAQNIEDRSKSVVLLAVGILCAATGGMMLTLGGVIPVIPSAITPI